LIELDPGLLHEHEPRHVQPPIQDRDRHGAPDLLERVRQPAATVKLEERDRHHKPLQAILRACEDRGNGDGPGGHVDAAVGFCAGRDDHPPRRRRLDQLLLLEHRHAPMLGAGQDNRASWRGSLPR
jgi:hypothetical protein